MKKFLGKKTTQHLQRKGSSSIGNISLKMLVVAMASITAIPVSQADTGLKQIGDLEIYQAAKGGKVTIMMMLDTSGSMDEPYMRKYFSVGQAATACNLPNDTQAYISLDGSEKHTSTVANPDGKFLGFSKYGCVSGGTITNATKYFYKSLKYEEAKSEVKKYTGTGIRRWTGYQWQVLSGFTDTKKNTNQTGATAMYQCDSAGSIDKNQCTTPTTSSNITGMTAEAVPGNPVTAAPVVSKSKVAATFRTYDSQGYTVEIAAGADVETTITITTTEYTTYYKKSVAENQGGSTSYDRLTELKKAIFELLDKGGLDPNKVAIGVGQFSSQSKDANGNLTADSKTGRILVPAALLTPQQVADIKTAVANLRGTGGTPTANAYAEAGAFMLGTTTKPDSNTSSGFDKSEAGTKSGAAYNNSTIKNSEAPTCDGRGVYFLTDGVPNSVTPSDTTAIMKNALSSKGATFAGTSTMPDGSDAGKNAMPQVGAFAQALREGSKNPNGNSILTAVVGFGSEFDTKKIPGIVQYLDTPEVDKATGLPKKDADGKVIYKKDAQGKIIKNNFFDCNKITGVDAKNACNWGAKTHPDLAGVGGFGEGGFYSAMLSDDVVTSIIKFVGDLNQTLPSTPSGTIVVPDDPYRIDSQMAVAYYPTLQAEVASSPAIWAGNMKKFKLNEGTLYGNSDIKLFKDSSGALNPEAEDLWSSKPEPGKNNAVTAGGLYSNLTTPKDAMTNVRKIYIEDKSAADNSKPQLRLLSVNASGKVTLDNIAITASNTFIDTDYTKERVQTLLQFMGFTLTDAQKALEIKDLVLTAPATEIKVLGATVHSTPSAISYYATLDTDGKITDTRDDYMLFGSSDGALHLVDSDSYTAGGNGGKEYFAFVPKAMLINQPQALTGGTSGTMGKPYFGVDAPWLVSATYNYDTDNNKVTVTPCAHDSAKGDRECENASVYAYGGLRMGGEAIYGMNLTDKDTPKLMFTITPTIAGFERMGQIWSKPTKAKIRTSKTDTKGTDVLVFGGGYDTCYENPYFQIGVPANETNKIDAACAAKTEAKGNALYIVNAKTGDLIWSASSTGSPTTSVAGMKNSVVGGITVLDRNNDGFMDHLYYADLGGQVFRADFANATATAGSFSNTRVVKVLKNKYEGTTTPEFAFRFYERPVISFYRNNNNRLFAMVNVISGDRSSPLAKTRTNNADADRVYGLIDNDVTQADSIFYASSFTTTAKDIIDSDLVAMGSSGALNATQKTALTAPLKADTKKGWYYPLTRFDGYGDVKYSKGIGKSEVINSFLFTTVYNPDISYSTADACAAKVTGGSERELYCLPYGICMDDGSKNGTGGFSPAGQGIQELTLGPRSANKNNQRLLIGTMTLTERSSSNTDLGYTRVDFGADSKKKDRVGQTGISTTLGDGSAPEYIFNERYSMTPKTWFEGNRKGIN